MAAAHAALQAALPPAPTPTLNGPLEADPGGDDSAAEADAAEDLDGQTSEDDLMQELAATDEGDDEAL
eukprot:1322364-Alexandrium_andersonii.AAC.1